MNLQHPCFDEKAHYRYGRIHLPVAPHCNIKCRYCSREIGISYHSQRPAICREILSPHQAAERVAHYMNEALKVVGIAGPGEPLVNPETYETLSLVHEQFPHLIKCVSTNGLLLQEKAPLLAEVGVKTVTVTLNAVTPATVKKIYAHIEGKMNDEVAASFTAQQLEGISACKTLGMHVKINSILIPHINAEELELVAIQAQKRGAYIHNITPLIPLSEFSTMRPPTDAEIQRVREQCEKYLPQFTCCKQCSADAVGIPGKGDRF